MYIDIECFYCTSVRLYEFYLRPIGHRTCTSARVRDLSIDLSYPSRAFRMRRFDSPRRDDGRREK